MHVKHGFMTKECRNQMTELTAIKQHRRCANVRQQQRLQSQCRSMGLSPPSLSGGWNVLETHSVVVQAPIQRTTECAAVSDCASADEVGHSHICWIHA